MIEVVLPKLGFDMEEGTIVKWLLEEGQSVEKGEPLLEIETNKVTMQIESPGSGVLTRIIVPPGEVRPVGTVIAYLLEPGEDLSVAAPLAEEAAEAWTERCADTVLGPEGETHPGVEVVASRPLATAVARRLAEQERVDLQRVVGTGPRGRVTKADVEAYIQSGRSTPPDRPAQKVRASQPARRAARQAGIALQEIEGTGPHGRILESDIVEYLREAEAGTQIHHPSRLESIMAERMAGSFSQAPHFYLTTEVDATSLVELRRGLVAAIEAGYGVRLTYTDLLLRLVAQALARHPRLNASWKDGKIQVYPQVNLGLAVAVDDGLIVPVLKDAASRSLIELALQREELTQKAKEGRLALQDVMEGTFTLTNLGMFEVDVFHAILNPPQSAILATGRIRERVAVLNGAVCVRPTLFMTLTVDHRVVDGATGARFLQDLKMLLESPYGVLMP